MSRVGKKPVVIPAGVKLELKDETLTVTGPKGTLTLAVHPKIKLEISEKEAVVKVEKEDNKKERALWGLFRALIQNLVDGVTKGFEKKLELNGVGFKIQISKADQAKEAYKKQLSEGKQNLVAEATYAVARLAQLNGQLLEMRLGFAHPVFLEIPKELNVTVEKNLITVTGADKQQVGQFASEVRELKKPEPYKGKGFKYSDEVVLRKAGKVVKVVGGGK
jgi:large subunit ribosomal protein L6